MQNKKKIGKAWLKEVKWLTLLAPRLLRIVNSSITVNDISIPRYQEFRKLKTYKHTFILRRAPKTTSSVSDATERLPFDSICHHEPDNWAHYGPLIQLHFCRQTECPNQKQN